MASDDEHELPDSGAVFTFGRSGFADNQPSHFFIRNDPIVEISCGDEHTAVVCERGRVFLFGHNDYGQLGLGHKRVVHKPSCLKYLKPFHSTHVACGKGHTLVSTACGRLFSFGSNSDGQLGLGDLNDGLIPQLVDTERFNGIAIKSVSAGCFHSACLTDAGEVYLWGSNSDGQCGTEVDSNLLVPTKLQFENPIDVLSCGYYHTAIISGGDLYTFGESDAGKLGSKRGKSDILLEKVEISAKCVEVTCGGNHTLVLSDDGRVYAFGSNFSGQLGIGSNNGESYSPVPVDLPKNVKVISMSAGESHSAFVTANGELYTCGDSRYGKICFENDSIKYNSPTIVDLFANFHCSLVSCGGCHTMILALLRREASHEGMFTSRTKNTNLPPLNMKRVLGATENILSNREPSLSEEKNNEIEAIITEIESLKPVEEENKVMNDSSFGQSKIIPHFNDENVDGKEKDADEKERNVDDSKVASELDSKDAADREPADTGSNVKPKGGIKKLINILKRKDTDAVIVVPDIPSINKGAEKDNHEGITNGNQQRSKACVII